MVISGIESHILMLRSEKINAVFRCRFQFDWGDGVRRNPLGNIRGNSISETRTFNVAGTQIVKVSKEK